MTEALEHDATPSAVPMPAAYPVGPVVVEMYLHPQRFVSEYLPNVSLGVWRTLALLWFIGVANAGSDGGLQRLLPQDSWYRYWVVRSVVACVVGPLGIAGSMIWLQLRLKLCGVSVHTGNALRLVVASWTAIGMPPVITALARTIAYASPMAARSEWRLAWLDLASLAVLALEYSAARSMFGVTRGRARFWFLIFPVALATLIYGVYPYVRGVRH